MRKYSKFKDFRKLVAEQWGIPADQQFWWPWERRMNHTYRPCRPRFGSVEDEMFVTDLENNSGGSQARQWPPRLNLFLQVTNNNATIKMIPSPRTTNPLVLGVGREGVLSS